MNNRRLTQRLIDTLKPGKSVREFRDVELRSFGVRILPSGRKRFFVHACAADRSVGATAAMSASFRARVRG